MASKKFTEEDEKQLDQEAYRFLLENPHGKRILWKIISMCGVYRASADNSGSWTYFKEGQRAIGLNLISEICEASPEGYIKLQQNSLKGAK